MKKKFYYYFKITLLSGRGDVSKEKIYREIAVLANQTLATLASIIVRSFNFNFDHCYGFYNNFDNYFKSTEMYELFTDIPEDPTPGAKGVTYIKVATVFPDTGKRMLFLFDYGDNWTFSIELIDIKLAPGNAKYPKIFKKVGKSPKQYPPIKEDFEESEKLKKIVFASDNKITDDAYKLVKALFKAEDVIITNDSRLEDFWDFGVLKTHDEKIKEMFVEQIADKFGVIVPEILSGETRIWKVVELINEKQKKLLFPKLNIKKRTIS